MRVNDDDGVRFCISGEKMSKLEAVSVNVFWVAGVDPKRLGAHFRLAARLEYQKIEYFENHNFRKQNLPEAVIFVRQYSKKIQGKKFRNLSQFGLLFGSQFHLLGSTVSR